MSVLLPGDQSSVVPVAEPSYWEYFPARCSPLAVRVEEHSQEWRSSYGIAQSPAHRARLDATPAGHIAARLFPAARQDILELAADILLWLTSFDDVWVEAPESTPAALAPRIASAVAVLHGGTPPVASAFTHALSDVTERISLHLTGGQAARLLAALNQNLLAMLWESTTGDRDLTMTEYIAMRPLSVSGTVVAALIEPGADLDLTCRVRTAPLVRSLDHQLATLIGWTNDVYSFGSEQRTGLRSCPSLPALLARDRGLDMAEALMMACTMCDEVALRALHSIERLAQAPDPQLSVYGSAVRDAIGSGHDLYTRLLADRYAAECSVPSPA